MAGHLPVKLPIDGIIFRISHYFAGSGQFITTSLDSAFRGLGASLLFVNSRTHKPLFLEQLPVLALAANFDPNQISSNREISATVLNVSGRQRMLSQRTALLSLRLVYSQDQAEREKLRHQLLAAIDLMEQSHRGLLNGDRDLNLPGQPSAAIAAMYFEPPIDLDRQIRKYISEVRALAQVEERCLTQDNSHLCYILAASTPLLEALDAVVSQYQRENEAEQLALDITQAELYYQTCASAAAAQAQAQQLEKTLHELKQTQAQLIHTERICSLGQLVASVAHEINNPVNFIHGNLTYANTYVQDLIELLHLYQEQYPQPNAAIAERIAAIDLEYVIEDLPKVLSSMTVGIERISKIVLSLRNFSRVDETRMKPVDVHEGIDSTLLILHSRLKAKDNHPAIQIIKEYGNLPLVECYAGQLNQVFMNILGNAIDALEEGHRSWRMGRGGNGEKQKSYLSNAQCPMPKIWIHTEVLHPNHITVRISDNGPGMTEEVKAQLFNAFFTTKPTGKGTGLGLSICHQIVVEKHGGSIRCESSPGKGTEFRIEIPIQQRVCASQALATCV